MYFKSVFGKIQFKFYPFCSNAFLKERIGFQYICLPDNKTNGTEKSNHFL